MNWNRDKKSVNGGISCMLGLGGKFKQGIGVETRTFRKRKL